MLLGEVQLLPADPPVPVKRCVRNEFEPVDGLVIWESLASSHHKLWNDWQAFCQQVSRSADSEIFGGQQMVLSKRKEKTGMITSST